MNPYKFTKSCCQMSNEDILIIQIRRGVVQGVPRRELRSGFRSRGCFASINTDCPFVALAKARQWRGFRTLPHHVLHLVNLQLAVSQPPLLASVLPRELPVLPNLVGTRTVLSF